MSGGAPRVAGMSRQTADAFVMALLSQRLQAPAAGSTTQATCVDLSERLNTSFTRMPKRASVSIKVSMLKRSIGMPRQTVARWIPI